MRRPVTVDWWITWQEMHSIAWEWIDSCDKKTQLIKHCYQIGKTLGVQVLARSGAEVTLDPIYAWSSCPGKTVASFVASSQIFALEHSRRASARCAGCFDLCFVSASFVPRGSTCVLCAAHKAVLTLVQTCAGRLCVCLQAHTAVQLVSIIHTALRQRR